MIGEVGLGSNEMLGMKSKDSPSKVISIPGSHRRQRTYSEQTCQQLELSLDLNASSPSGATLYDSPDLVPHPLASPSTPRITAADASMRNGGFFYDLPAHYEQSNDLSRYPDMEKSLGQMQADSLDLGWGLERGCGGGDDSTTVTMFGDVEMNKSKALISEEVMVDNGKGPTLAALNADATDSSVFEDIECIIMTDCMLSSATSVPQSFSGKAEPPVVVTASTEDTKPTWHTLDLSKCEDTKPAWPTNLLNAGKPNLQALLMASLAQHPKTPPVDNILQKTPILARQLSNASSATPTVDQGSSSPAVTATSPTLQFSGNIVGGQVLNVIPNVTLLGPLQIVSQPTTLTCTLQQSPQNNMDVTTVVSAAPPPLMSPLSSTPISTLPPVVPKKPVVVTAAAAAGKPATSATSQKPATVVSGKPAKIEEKVSGLREIIGKKRSISPGSEGSIERKWEEIMEFINNEEHDDVDGTPQPEKKIKLEPQDVAFNPTDQLDEDEDEYDSDGAGSDRENDDMSDAESVTSHSSFVEDFIASGRKEKRYFWQYNMQSKGPKGKRLCKTVEAADPHILNDFEDPVFDPELNEMRYKHNGKARRGDGNDITPSPHKLFSLGTELNQLNKKITCMTPVSELPVPARTTSRREKNKYASRACRLKKKAQHEANKLKLHGLQREHHQLMLVLGSIKHAILSHLDRPDMKREHSFHDSLDGLIKQNLRSMIAGHTAEYVNSVLERVAGGDSSGGIYNSDEVNQESAGTSKVGAVNCDSWA